MLRKPTSEYKSDFRRDIPEYSDKAIIDILKNRDHYQSEAAELAINEAIKRGLINSKEDLYAEEFRVQPIQFSLFPDIKKDKNRSKIRKSIARAMVISGVMPMVFGIIKLNAGKSVEGVLITMFGIFWIFLSAQLMKQFSKSYIHLMFICVFMAVLYIVFSLVTRPSLLFMDVFIPIVLILLILYGLVFILRIEKSGSVLK